MRASNNPGSEPSQYSRAEVARVCIGLSVQSKDGLNMRLYNPPPLRFRGETRIHNNELLLIIQ